MAVRIPPTWGRPVGLGAKRTLTGSAMVNLSDGLILPILPPHTAKIPDQALFFEGKQFEARRAPLRRELYLELC